MVIVNALGVVHDLATRNRCSEVTKLRGEFSQGTERYAPVKGVQAQAYQLPGCTTCFGSQAAFREHISTN